MPDHDHHHESPWLFNAATSHPNTLTLFVLSRLTEPVEDQALCPRCKALIYKLSSSGRYYYECDCGFELWEDCFGDWHYYWPE